MVGSSEVSDAFLDAVFKGLNDAIEKGDADGMRYLLFGAFIPVCRAHIAQGSQGRASELINKVGGEEKYKSLVELAETLSEDLRANGAAVEKYKSSILPRLNSVFPKGWKSTDDEDAVQEVVQTMSSAARSFGPQRDEKLKEATKKINDAFGINLSFDTVKSNMNAISSVIRDYVSYVLHSNVFGALELMSTTGADTLEDAVEIIMSTGSTTGNGGYTPNTAEFKDVDTYVEAYSRVYGIECGLLSEEDVGELIQASVELFGKFKEKYSVFNVVMGNVVEIATKFNQHTMDEYIGSLGKLSNVINEINELVMHLLANYKSPSHFVSALLYGGAGYVVEYNRWGQPIEQSMEDRINKSNEAESILGAIVAISKGIEFLESEKPMYDAFRTKMIGNIGYVPGEQDKSIEQMSKIYPLLEDRLVTIESYISGLEGVGLFSQDRINSLKSVVTDMRSLMPKILKKYVDSLENIEPPVEKFSGADADSVKKSVIESYPKTSFFKNERGKVVAVLLTSEKWSSQNEEHVKTRQNIYNETEFKKTVERYNWMSGYVVLDEGDYYKLLHVGIRQNINTDGSTSSAYISGIVDNPTTMYISKNKLRL